MFLRTSGQRDRVRSVFPPKLPSLRPRRVDRRGDDVVRVSRRETVTPSYTRTYGPGRRSEAFAPFTRAFCRRSRRRRLRLGAISNVGRAARDDNNPRPSPRTHACYRTNQNVSKVFKNNLLFLYLYDWIRFSLVYLLFFISFYKYLYMCVCTL